MKISDDRNIVQFITPPLLLLILTLPILYLMPQLSYKYSIALILGVILIIVCFLNTTVSLYILIFSMLLGPEFIVASTGAGTAGRGITLRLDDFILMIIGFTWFVKVAIYKDLGLFLKTPLNKPIAYYLLACLISTLLNSIFGRVRLLVGFLFVFKYFEYIFIYFMVLNHIQKKEEIRGYLYAMLITCVLVSIWSILQIPKGGRLTAPFEGKIGEPNTFGGYLLFMISITLGLFLNCQTFKERLIYGAMIILFFIPLIYTQSRGTYLGIIPAVLSFTWFYRKGLIYFLFLLLIGGTFLFFAPNPMKKRIAYTFMGKIDRSPIEVLGARLDTSTAARIFSWKSALRDWRNRPIFGYGVTGYRFLDAQYFRTLIETGIIGLMTLFLLLNRIFKNAYNVLKKAIDPLDRGLSMGFLTGFIGLLFHALGANTFIIVRIMEPFWFALALIMVIQRSFEEEEGSI